MRAPIVVEAVSEVVPELIEAMTRLLPQLSPSAPVPSPEQLREVIASPSTVLLVARDRTQGGQIVGSLTLATFRIPTGMRAWIEDVVVDAAARGRGIGEALTREALRVAAARGAQSVDLTSRPAREAANRLYRHIGFQLRATNLYRHSSADEERAE